MVIRTLLKWPLRLTSVGYWWGWLSYCYIYQINAGPDSQTPTRGWQSNSFDEGTWNGNANSTEDLRVWNQANYGEDLIIGARGSKLFYWDTSAGTGTRAVEVAGVNNGTAVNLSQSSTGNINSSFDFY